MHHPTLYFTANGFRARKCFTGALCNLLEYAENRPLVFLCIGSDRATGDSLGPFVGEQLSQYENHSLRNKKTAVYGTLRHTVHAGNLEDTLIHIYNRFAHPFLIAIDASLGVPDHVGCVTLGQGCLLPGIGVNQSLPAAGDIHITGIVNRSTENNYQILQTTRLYTVTSMAAFISEGILSVLHGRSALQRTQKRHLIDIF